MKITENDIKVMVAECVRQILAETKDTITPEELALNKKRLQAMRQKKEDEKAGKKPIKRGYAPMRDVRKIIIGNILNKHKGFEGDEDVAWAYYVLNHQGKREGDECEFTPELNERLKKAIYREKQRLKAKQEEMKGWSDEEVNALIAKIPAADDF